ncbi:copper transporter [Nostocoides jenkinsii]|uniref:Channel-forming protein n=1 Tax=Nostocoides jenkinsii Ben 74 TaxID=1193518 RepID=A0A077M7L4_9MICO|nr:copper transporter [Tetrasphaera jenkinsii]CCI51810.1 conserved exported hypothetical protein [Tetrasphaera jenkinsii Ben 74]
MIDFRYHLVSLASVLIALAVGIVLGAGPLNSGILESVNSEVKTLRQDKTDLRTQLDAATRSLAAHQNFEAARLPDTVSGKLSGRAVTIVTLPGTPAALITTTEDTLAAAGARVVGRVALGASYADPAPSAVAARESLGAELSTLLAIPDGAVTGTPLDAVIAVVLAAKVPVVGETTSTPYTPTTESREEAWRRLRAANIVDRALPASTATAIVVLTGPGREATETASAEVEADAALTAALDSRADGAVLAGTLDPAQTAAVSAIASSRSDSAMRRAVSTVDDAATTIGQASIVFGLAEQLTGRSGQYGVAPGATSAFPAGG